jgi:hypothetical protein
MTKNRKFMRSGAALTALLAFAALGNPTAASAQEVANNSAQPGIEQSIGPEGSWFYTVNISGFTFQGIETYSRGGGYVEADQLSFSPQSVASAGHGAWKLTGSNTFVLTYVNITFDSFNDGMATGTLRVRQTTTLDQAANTYSGSGDYTYYGPDGKPTGVSGTFTITAKRIPVEPPAQQLP